MKIYLAGPIFQSSDEEAKDWRKHIKELGNELNYKFVEFLDPLDPLDPMSRDYSGKEEDSVFDIVEGAKEDIRKCDVVIANVSKPSAGTSMEILFAWQLGIPVVTIQSGRLSPWIRYHSYWIVGNVEDALKWAFVSKWKIRFAPVA